MSQQHEDIEDALVEGEGAEALAALASLLPAARSPASSSARDTLLAALTPFGRLDRFAAQAAAMLDLDEAAAKPLLDAAALPASYTPSPFPGVRLYHIEGGPAVRDAITGFVRIEAGAAFPDHDHLGEERVLIVQGSCVDTSNGKIFRAGDVAPGGPGGVHGVVARPGPDLVYLAVLAGGLKVGDMVLRPGDPSI